MPTENQESLGNRQGKRATAVRVLAPSEEIYNKSTQGT